MNKKTTKLKLGKKYEVRFLDHFDTRNRKPSKIKGEIELMTTMGLLACVDDNYYHFTHFWDKEMSSNCDWTSVVKKAVIGAREVG